MKANAGITEILRSITDLSCDRHHFISDFLTNAGLSPIPVTIGQARFILLRFDNKLYSPKLGPVKVLAAHHDSAPGSPGANDNAAAVVQLMLASPRLAGATRPHNTIMLFTDKEEADLSGSPKTQGSFMLGEFFRSQGMKDLVFMNLDMTGRGDTVVISEAAELFLASRNKSNTELYKKLHNLRELLLTRIPQTVRGRFLSLRTPFSDNLGFLLQGFPAIHLTLLPFHEASLYKKQMDTLKDDLAQTGNSSGNKINGVPAASVFRARFAAIQPETWRLRHGQADTVDSLDMASFPLMEEVIQVISKLDMAGNR
ncbi:MAG: M28 family peptidase [Spirochaetaceae bacterium]|nr:MAG: M28 family peptidase [Spirochaetaceae bacterium]